MSRAVLLDAGPLGLVTNPNLSPVGTLCSRWLQELLTSGVRIIAPEIADYEIRRELLRAHKTAGLAKLDALTQALEYRPITHRRHASRRRVLGASSAARPANGSRRQP